MPTARGVSRLMLVGLCVLGSAHVLSAQTPAADPYYDFIMARHLESEGDTRGALAALQRAAAAAPKVADIRAEIAGYYLRQNNATEAERAASEALRLDPNSIDAHRVLGLLAAATPSRAKEAIGHLEKVFVSPAGATDVSLQFTLGRLYFLNDDLPKAIDILNRIVQDQPYLAQARTLLVQALTAAGRTNDAIDVLEPALEGDPRLSATLAQLYDQAGRKKDALAAYGKAASLNPANRDLQIRYASALLSAGGRDNARKALGVIAALLERNGKDAGALYLQAQAHRQAGDVFAAERSARAILAADPNSTAGTYALVQVFTASRRFKDVIELLEPFVASMASRGENPTMLLTYLSGAYQSLGQHDHAIDALKRAKTADKDKEDAAGIDVYLVQAYLLAKRYSDAASLAADAQKTYPDDVRFIQLQARALMRSGSTAQALGLLEALVKKAPDGVESYTALAELYGNAGRVDDGLRVLNEAARRFPNEMSIPFRRGAVLAEAKRDAEAEQAFRDVLSHNPDQADALNYLGYMFAERGQRLDEAIRLITRALELEEDNPSYLDSLGWAFFKSGDLPQAEKNLTRAADVLTFNSVVQDHYGDVLAKVGKYREAVTAWTKALNGDGDDIDRPAIERKIRDARTKFKN
jgi:tetratricopeptide (TPR) repeat protein